MKTPLITRGILLTALILMSATINLRSNQHSSYARNRLPDEFIEEQKPGEDSQQSIVDIRGKITDIRRAKDNTEGLPAVLTVKGSSDKDTRFDRATITVTFDTRITAKKGITHCSIPLAYISVGHRIEARFTGPVRESYPVQATAS